MPGRLRQQTFETAIIERYRRRESSVEEALIEMYLAGVSGRGHHRGAVGHASQPGHGLEPAQEDLPAKECHPLHAHQGLSRKGGETSWF